MYTPETYEYPPTDPTVIDYGQNPVYYQEEQTPITEAYVEPVVENYVPETNPQIVESLGTDYTEIPRL